MITGAIEAAISAYSIDVAPDSSARNHVSICFIARPLCRQALEQPDILQTTLASRVPV
jgi:hypothetical protein